MGIGATMYYPVAVEGALLSMGDAHTAQGDSEFDGKLQLFACRTILCIPICRQRLLGYIKVNATHT